MEDIQINWQPNNPEDELIKLVPLVETDSERIYEVAANPRHYWGGQFNKVSKKLLLDYALILFLP